MFQIISGKFNLLLIGRSRNGKECKPSTNQIDVENEPPIKKVKPTINSEDTKTFAINSVKN